MSNDRARLRQSLRNFKRLLSLEPRHAGHLEQLARISAQLDRPKDAARFLVDRAQVLLDNEEAASALVDLGNALRFDGRNRRARKMHAELTERLGAMAPAESKLTNPLPPLSTPTPAPLSGATPAPLTAPTPAPVPNVRRPNLGLAHPRPKFSLKDLIEEPAIPADELLQVREAPMPEDTPISADQLLAVHEAEELSMELELDDADLGSAEVVDLDDSDDTMQVLLSDANERTDEHDALDSMEEVAGADQTMPSFQVPPEEEDDDSTAVGLQSPLLDAVETTPATQFQPEVLENLEEVRALRRLPASALTSLESSAEVRVLAAGEALFTPETRWRGVWVVYTGAVTLSREFADGYEPIGVRKAGALIGTVPLVREQALPQRCVGFEGAELRLLPSDVVEPILRRHAPTRGAVEVCAERELTAWLLCGHKLFGCMPTEARDELTRSFRARTLKPDEVLLEEGQVPDGLYLVASGRLEIEARSVRVGGLSPGDTAGVASALDGSAAQATLRAVQATEVFCLPPDAVEACLADPQVRAAFERSARMRRLVVENLTQYRG